MRAKRHPDRQDLSRKLKPALNKMMGEKRTDYESYTISSFSSEFNDPHQPALMATVSFISDSENETSVEKHKEECVDAERVLRSGQVLEHPHSIN